MTTLLPREPNVSVRQVEDWAALSSGAVMLLYGATTRSKAGIYVAAASAPLLSYVSGIGAGLAGRYLRFLLCTLAPATARHFIRL